MVNEKEIISPSLLHHSLSSFLSSFFSLIPIIISPNSLLTLIPFSNIHFPFLLLPFSLPFFFNRFFPISCSFFSFPIWVSLFSLLASWVRRFVGVLALSSPGVLK